MTDTITITDELLEQAEAEIKDILKDKKLTHRDRKMFEVMQYFLMFLMTDHKKINKIEKASLGLWISQNKKLAVIYGVVSTLFIGLMANLWFLSEFRRPIIRAIVKSVFGIDLTDELIP